MIEISNQCTTQRLGSTLDLSPGDAFIHGGRLHIVLPDSSFLVFTGDYRNASVERLANGDNDLQDLNELLSIQKVNLTIAFR